MVRSRSARGAVEVPSWCASGSVRLVNFSTGDTVYIYIYILYIIIHKLR